MISCADNILFVKLVEVGNAWRGSRSNLAIAVNFFALELSDKTIPICEGNFIEVRRCWVVGSYQRGLQLL